MIIALGACAWIVGNIVVVVLVLSCPSSHQVSEFINFERLRSLGQSLACIKLLMSGVC